MFAVAITLQCDCCACLRCQAVPLMVPLKLSHTIRVHHADEVLITITKDHDAAGQLEAAGLCLHTALRALSTTTQTMHNTWGAPFGHILI